MIRVHQTQLFRDLGQDLIQDIYDELDFLWDTVKLIPCPIQFLATKYHLTRTEIMYTMLGWYDLRCKKGY